MRSRAGDPEATDERLISVPIVVIVRPLDGCTPLDLIGRNTGTLTIWPEHILRIIIGMTDARSAPVARFGPRGAASTRTKRGEPRTPRSYPAPVGDTATRQRRACGARGA